jgi:hypothetical protein
MCEFIIPFLHAVVSSVLPNHMHMMTTVGGSSYDDNAFPYVPVTSSQDRHTTEDKHSVTWMFKVTV